jgi:hypothetical protein
VTPAQCANLLERHQTWRRYDGEIGGGPDMLPPKVVGEAIDAAIAMAHRFDDIGDLLCQALDYLNRNGLKGSPLRDGDAVHNALGNRLPATGAAKQGEKC